MGKGSGSTRKSTSSSPKGLTSGGGDFKSNTKMSDFTGETFGSGGYYTLTKGNYTMEIETDNGYNDERGMDGTTITVSMRKGTGKSEIIYNSFVEGAGYTESWGHRIYDNPVAKRIEGSMPYIAELANKWKKANS